jgi:hypothetical protein
MSCTRCGALITPGSKFCPACGKAVAPQAVAAMPAPAAAPAAGMPGFWPAPAPELLAGPPADPNPTLPRSTNGLAVASLVLGIVWLYWIGSILALIFGYIAKGQIADSQGRQTGRGMAIAGIVLGYVGIGFLALGIIAFLLANKPH